VSELAESERPPLPLSTLRHSASHVLAQAVLALYPGAKLGIGPAIEDGFYYDFDLETPLSNEDLPKIEKLMKQIIKEKQVFSCYELSRDEAEKKLELANQPYKLELLKDLDLPTYSFYENGPFVDLCRGPHVENTKPLKVFKLLKVSGAYWRGSEKNKMLQRIYGTAFYTKDELYSYIKRLEEAKKRDHRVLGKALDLFSINDDIGSGLILWHPKGARIRHLIEEIWRNRHFKSGYELLYSPHIGKSHLWETSGHLDNYRENMFAPMVIDEQDYFIRPMNCPFHILVYQSASRSYRQLPIRYAELGTVYRFERSGVLHGLMRVRGFTQDDAHIICTPEQVNEEISSVLEFCIRLLKQFGFTAFKIFVSTKPVEKAVGDDVQWEHATAALTDAVKLLGLDYDVDEGGGAFYGPKIDIKIKDSIGREWQCSTIQFDFNLPEKFNMSYINNQGEKARPVMIHRALLGSLERFFGILIEHYAGKFPLFLAPVQVVLLPIKASHFEYSEMVSKALREHNYRVDIDKSDEKIGYKVRHAIKQKIPYMVIIGDKEVETKTLSVRGRDEGEIGALNMDSFCEKLALINSES
jgi:threonyl-tRNA synthetase